MTIATQSDMGSGCELNVNSIIKKDQNREFFIFPILALAIDLNKSKHYKINQNTYTLLFLARQTRGQEQPIRLRSSR